MGKTKIEWTDETVNPLRARNLETGKVGHWCVKISPGCRECYASHLQTGPYLSGIPYEVGNENKVETYLDTTVLDRTVMRRRKPTKFFWADMTDLFLPRYSDEDRDTCFAYMALASQHTHQVLTKRADLMHRYFQVDPNARLSESPEARIGRRAMEIAAARGENVDDPWWDAFWTWPIPNLWLGVSTENQEWADKRIPLLLQTPAARRYVSMEPLLGKLKVEDYLEGHEDHGIGWDFGKGAGACVGYTPPLDWGILGGESGGNARLMDIDWAYSLVDQFQRHDVPLFVKQLGRRVRWNGISAYGEHWPMRTFRRDMHGWWRVELKHRKGGDPEEWPTKLRLRQFPEAA